MVDLVTVLGRLPRTRRQATHELVAEVLREAIISGVLRANQPLPQDEIASQLRVSHIPVREALRQLQSEGLVTYQPNRGAAVSALTQGEIREIYQIRAILETAAIREATPHLTVEQLDQASKILDAAESSSDPAVWGSHDVDFHRLVYGLEGRPRLREMIDGLLRRVDRYWLSHGIMLRHRHTFEREHRALLEAVRSRDADLAGRLLGEHLAGAAELLVTELDELEAHKGGLGLTA
ncbi:MAG TPA: GntR family transcriptional regulator [Gemmatimonadales bacterium]|nr:GntR family transcriptional regulator [Gemmatimonadales bacterium]